MNILENCSMKNRSNMKIGGEARKFIEIENKEELPELLKELDNYFIIGNGTNTLLNDKFLDITFVSLKKLNKVTDLGNGRINVEAGLDFGKLIKYMSENDLSGLEELAGIPGTVGGLVFMNGGAYGKEIFDCIESVEILDKEKNIKVIPKEELKIDYRKTEIKENNWVIISADFKFEKGYKKELVKEIHARGMKVILDGVFNHCGSFNKWLDRECIYEGQKGYEPGAYVSEASPYHDFFGFTGGVCRIIRIMRAGGDMIHCQSLTMRVQRSYMTIFFV